MDRFRLDDRIALVTGAGSGIGRAIAVGLAEAGADVACFGHDTHGGLSETARLIGALGRRALVLPGDVTSDAEIDAAVAAVEDELGELGIAVNNAGIGGGTPAADLATDTFQHLYDVNVAGVFRCCRAEARVMLERRRGSIINIGSISATIANRGLFQAHYNSSKAAVVHLTKSLAMEWARAGVRVNCISPGYTRTPMNERPEVADAVAGFERDTPLGRLAEVDEMVGPAVFLASEASSYVTGIDLLVDGGYVCW